MFLMDPTTEIRKLSRSIALELVQILEYADSWKRLMAIIPRKLEKNVFECAVNRNNLHKYNSEHFRYVYNYSIFVHLDKNFDCRYDVNQCKHLLYYI